MLEQYKIVPAKKGKGVDVYGQKEEAPLRTTGNKVIQKTYAEAVAVSVRSWRDTAAPSSPDGNREGDRRELHSTLLPTGLDIAVDPVGKDHHARALCPVQMLKRTPDLKRKGFESISSQHIPYLPVDEEEEIPSTEIWVNLDEKRELEASSAVGASENVHFEHVLKLGRNVNNFNSSNGLIAPETSPAHNPKFIGPETSLDFPSYTSPDAQNNTFANSKVQQQELSNIANYLKLQEVDSVHLPVPMNFIFIGFEGKGSHEFKLLPEEIERWFTKIDHVFEHTRIRHEEVLIPFYKTNMDKMRWHHLPVVSHINYNFSVHAIEMGEKVTSIIEHAINVFGRKDDPVGSRRGLSEPEINLLKENKSLQMKLLQPEGIPENILALTKIQRPLYLKHPMMKFSWTRTEDTDIIEWYNIWLDALDNFGRLYQGRDTAEIIEVKALQLLKGKDQDLKLHLEKVLKSGDYSGFQAECLTDTWIGKDRWAFIDLSAGPFSWGPAVGGEGVRTEASLPSVEKTIGSASEISEEEAEDRLQDAIQEKFAVFGDKEHQAIDILLAEIDIYELFAFKHCKGRKVKLALCEELDERMRDLRNELQSFEGEEYDESHKKKAIEALKRMESWNLFSDTYEEFQNYTVARDSFLAHLGATLWGSMRHIVSPSVADGAFHYYEKISFQLFFMTQEKVRHIKQLPVDMKAIMDGFSSLMVPSQKPMFSPHVLPLSEDPALAMAFAVARRAAAVPLLLINGTYRKTVRTYLDSSILQYQLQRLNKHGSLKGRHVHSRSVLEVPVFWFIYSEPLLLDKYFQAKALSDMIIVVQSEPSSWESHLHCNGHSLLLNLRQPIKAAVAATAEHLAGLLPLHLVYGQAHETAIEDWLWSVGCNPFSITSQGWHLSQFQSDSIARSYVITTLEESIQLVNSAIHLLLMERTTEKTFRIFQSQEHELVNKYNYVVSLWKRVSTVTGELRYSDALRLLNTLEDASKRFVDQVNVTHALLHPINCTRERKIHMVFDMTTIPAFLIVLGCLYMVLRPRRPKPKIN
ncbi:hypothetical protein glysoja_037104 [Glycine soja]|uniref:DUF7906 domain-containing protein n=1 Tax=Glycine soja TaxID=3848 RepID=A0A0B2RLN0_GLYSO|nr:hypothetical protein glysoja_037104 [Glycine soja]